MSSSGTPRTSAHPSSSGTATISVPRSATMVPKRRSATTSAAATPKRVASRDAFGHHDDGVRAPVAVTLPQRVGHLLEVVRVLRHENRVGAARDPGMRPSQPLRIPTVSIPCRAARTTTPRTTALRPGQSPPAVRIPIASVSTGTWACRRRGAPWDGTAPRRRARRCRRAVRLHAWRRSAPRCRCLHAVPPSDRRLPRVRGRRP